MIPSSLESTHPNQRCERCRKPITENETYEVTIKLPAQGLRKLLARNKALYICPKCYDLFAQLTNKLFYGAKE